MTFCETQEEEAEDIPACRMEARSAYYPEYFPYYTTSRGLRGAGGPEKEPALRIEALTEQHLEGYTFFKTLILQDLRLEGYCA